MWDGYNVQIPVKVSDRGRIDDNARRVFKNGQCHALAFCIHKLTGWQTYGIPGFTRGVPTHVVVKVPDRGFLDIEGLGAEKRWAADDIYAIDPSSLLKIKRYMQPDIDAAMPFARRLVARMTKKTGGNNAKAS
jgi:hypothetical protein